MGYYLARGDYYRGDYHRGDPFLGGLLLGAAKKFAPKVGRFLKSRVLGAAKKAGGGMSVGWPEMARDVVVGSAGYAMGKRAGGSMPTLGPLEEEAQGVSVQGPGQSNVAVFISRDGRRIRKRWSVSQQRWIAIRKLNPLNPRALKRGLRRAEGFAKFAKRTMNGLMKPGSTRRFKKKSPLTARA